MKSSTSLDFLTGKVLELNIMKLSSPRTFLAASLLEKPIEPAARPVEKPESRRLKRPKSVIGAVTMFESGLNPNEEMINALTFTKFLVFVNILVIPLLSLTSLDLQLNYIVGLLVTMMVTGKIIENMSFS
ncbi:hypothetical protein HRED_06183 [Candidatus Haloredivivus sp. G17]|nr:hypothetical protein HRED_06183 [Candidatus Haloredivivus sp. G17]